MTRCTCEQAVREATAPLLAEIERMRTTYPAALARISETIAERAREIAALKADMGPATYEIRDRALYRVQRIMGDVNRGHWITPDGETHQMPVIVPSVPRPEPIWNSTDGGVDG